MNAKEQYAIKLPSDAIEAEESKRHAFESNQLVRINQVSELTTLSKSCINLWVNQGRMIPPITLSPTVKVWRLSDLRKWIDSQKDN